MDIQKRKEELTAQFNKLQETRNQSVEIANKLWNEMLRVHGAYAELEKLETTNKEE